MKSITKIRLSRELCSHYSQVSALAKEGPVAITVNGRQDTVLLSHEDYLSQRQYIEALESRLTLYAHLAQVADDEKLGRYQEMDEAFDDILQELETMEL